jgi:hypothetical protein
MELRKHVALSGRSATRSRAECNLWILCVTRLQEYGA